VISRDDIELVRKGYDALRQGDVDFVLTLIRPDIELEVHTERPDIAETVYRGHDGFLRNMAELTEVFDDFTLEPEELVEGDERIMVVVRAAGRGKSSGVDIEQRLFHVWTIRDSKATRLEIYSDRATALEAAGIESKTRG
jgi:ketosteroid isomerase-like protein